MHPGLPFYRSLFTEDEASLGFIKAQPGRQSLVWVVAVYLEAINHFLLSQADLAFRTTVPRVEAVRLV